MNNLSDEYYSPIRKAGQLLKIIIANTPFFSRWLREFAGTPRSPRRGSLQVQSTGVMEPTPSTSPCLSPCSCMASQSARAEPASKSPAQS